MAASYAAPSPAPSPTSAPTPPASPHFIDVIEGKTYAWCACGRSANQPFCDGSHAGSGTEPVSYTAARSCRVVFCGCKASKRAPICDGSHNSA